MRDEAVTFTALEATIGILLREAALTSNGGSVHPAINRLEALVLHHPYAVLFADNTGQYTGANAAAAQLTGLSRGELLKSSVFDITKIEEERDVEVLWRAFLRSGRQGGDIILRQRDGAEITARYLSIANLLPGVHVSVFAKI